MSAPPSPRGGAGSSASAAAAASSSSPPSSSSASGDPEALRRMSKVINSLLARGDSGPFREPVDWRGLELYDYPKIIKKMMDLGTVKRKLERGQYRNAHECAEDIRLIWTNCKTYNADGSDFFLLAESFSRRFEDRYKKIKAELDTGEDSAGRRSSAASSSKGSSAGADGGGGPATLEAKARFGSSLFRLTGLEMGHVMQVIDLRCPQALVDPDPEGAHGVTDDGGGGGGGGGGGAEVEIDVDAIDPRTFAELERYVREKVSPPTAAPGTGTGGPSSSSHGGGGGGAGGRKRRGPSSAPKRRGSGVAAVQEEDDDDKDDEDDEEEEEEWQEDAGSKKRKR